MKVKIAKKWVSALRSKKYKQCFEYLHIPETEEQDDTYCVLGVLTDLYQQDQKKNHKKLLKTKTIDTGYESFVTFNGKNNYPPSCVAKWAGITKKEMDYLADMNDSDHSFESIANHIEKNPNDLYFSNDE